MGSDNREVLDKALSRFAWDEQEEAQRESREEEEKAEKEQMAQIDWHDFVVVETIEFTAEDNNIPLTAPIDVSTGAPQGAPVPLDSSRQGTVFQEAQIEKPTKGVEEDTREEAEVDMEKMAKEERERERAEQREKEKAQEEKEKEEREREREERER